MHVLRKKSVLVGCAAGLFVLIGIALAAILLGSFCPHTNTTFIVESAPTCVAEGRVAILCTDCNRTVETRILPHSGHAYEKSTAEAVAPTCTATGKEVFLCRLCGDRAVLVLPKASHDFVKDEAASRDATCLLFGKIVSVCTHCLCKEETDVAPTGHDWAPFDRRGDLGVAPCVKRICNTCSEVSEATEAHAYAVTANTATCTTGGEKTYTCAGCLATYTEASEKKGHTVTAWEEDADFAPITVGGCVKTFRHTGPCNSCCETVIEDYDAPAHKYQLTVTAVATCSVPGYKQLICASCGEEKTDGPVLSYYAPHAYEDDGRGGLLCACGAIAKPVDGAQVTLEGEDLSVEIAFQNGVLIKLPISLAEEITSGALLAANRYTKAEIAAAGNADLGAVPDGALIFDLILTVDERPISALGASATVKLPYKLSSGEDPLKITVYSLTSEGIEAMPGLYIQIDPTTGEGYVSFETDYFSCYFVGLSNDSVLCNRVGHDFLISQKLPTCTEGGYYIEACIHCGGFGQRRLLPANGHSTEVLPTSLAPTCTENGHNDLICTVCDHAYTVILPATGHAFSVLDPDDEIRATCTRPGKKTESCTNPACMAGHTVSSPVLPHRLESIVTAPTCTEGGYTTHTCRDCEREPYLNSHVASTDHRWDKEAPTCTEPQVCLVCGSLGLPATGVHTMANGRCTACGLGCTHEDAVKAEMSPTCARGGYTVYACVLCGRETIRNYTALSEHSFPNNFDPCTVCGMENVDLSGAVKALLQQLAVSGYTLSIEDVEVSFSSSASLGDGVIAEKGRAEFALDLCELVVSKTDVGTLLCASGYFFMHQVAENGLTEILLDGAIELYGDGEYLYCIPRFTTGENAGTKHFLRYRYDEFPSFFENTEHEELGALIEELFKTVTAHPSAAPWAPLMKESPVGVYQLFGKAYFSFFDSDATEDGYRYIFDYERFCRFNEDLLELSMTEMLDKYAGAGRTEALFDALAAAEGKRVVDFIADIRAFAEEKGISSDLIMRTVNEILALTLVGEPVDILTMAEVMPRTTTVGELYEALYAQSSRVFAISANLVSYHAFLSYLEAEMSVNTAHTYLPAEERQAVIDAVSSLADRAAVQFCLVIDPNGTLLSVEIGYHDFAYTRKLESGVEGGLPLYTHTDFGINATVTLLPSAVIPADGENIKREVETYLEDSASTTADS